MELVDEEVDSHDEVLVAFPVVSSQDEVVDLLDHSSFAFVAAVEDHQAYRAEEDLVLVEASGTCPEVEDLSVGVDLVVEDLVAVDHYDSSYLDETRVALDVA